MPEHKARPSLTPLELLVLFSFNDSLNLLADSFFFFFRFIYLFMRDTHKEREREAETQEEGEAGSMQGP